MVWIPQVFLLHDFPMVLKPLDDAHHGNLILDTPTQFMDAPSLFQSQYLQLE